MTNLRLGRLIWWTHWAKRDWAIAAAAGLSFLFFVFSLLSDTRTQPSNLPTVPLSSTSPTALLVPLTLLRNAKQRGAFCLDGSLPGYHFQKGFGSGSNNWVLHVEGGGWCNTIESCSYRKGTALGSSKYMDAQVQFSGILSHEASQNPDFFNWNKVKLRYCDGASFAGHPENEFKWRSQDFIAEGGTTQTVASKGQLIWEAVMDELLSIGMSSARQALLSGCSAGGLATLIHCDSFRRLLPKQATVKCLVDAGFFPKEKDVAGRHTIESFYQDVVHLQGVSKSLVKDCVASTEPFKCFFPQEFVQHLKTPIFLVQPAYDFWQIKNIFVPSSAEPRGNWTRCTMNIRNCSPSQIKVLEGYRNSLLKVLGELVQKKKEVGLFVNSCYIHCQTWMTETWHSPNSPRVKGKTIAESVGDWYFKRSVAKQIDCPYPSCNPTCYNMVFGQS